MDVMYVSFLLFLYLVWFIVIFLLYHTVLNFDIFQLRTTWSNASQWVYGFISGSAYQLTREADAQWAIQRTMPSSQLKVIAVG